jgi:hypothetical protein
MKPILIAAACALALGAGAATAQDAGQTPPFGSKDDAAYAKLIWEVLQADKLVGPGMIRTTPYEGTDPHGMMLETFYTSAEINGHQGDLVVKRNFGPAGVTKDAVLSAPDKHLGAITVMFRREAGYDPEDHNWFWIKFKPDGSVEKAANGLEMAGRVAKGADTGCIACHSAAPGDDMMFTTDFLAN